MNPKPAQRELNQAKVNSHTLTHNLHIEQEYTRMTEHVTEMVFGDYETEKDNIFKIAEDGEYQLQLKKWEFRPFNKSKKDAINFQFEIVNHELDPDANGITVFHQVGWNTGYLKMALLALAGSRISGNRLDIEELREGQSEFLDSLNGEIVEASVTVNTYTPEGGTEEVKNNKIVSFHME